MGTLWLMLVLLAITVGFLMWGISNGEQNQLQTKKVKASSRPLVSEKKRKN